MKNIILEFDTIYSIYINVKVTVNKDKIRVLLSEFTRRMIITNRRLEDNKVVTQHYLLNDIAFISLEIE